MGMGLGQQPSTAQLGAMLQNPMMRQAMSEMMANPALMSQATAICIEFRRSTGC
jgi:ABC-type dipeptide/oligopeptide/nickel transport system permease subunit